MTTDINQLAAEYWDRYLEAEPIEDKEVEVLAAIEATAPGSPEQAALHVGCLNHRCRGVAS